MPRFWEMCSCGQAGALGFKENVKEMTPQGFMARLARLIVFLLCGLTATLQAQQNGLGISPASVEAMVKRGTTYTQTFSLTNNTSERLRLKCSVIDYWYDENNKRLTGRPGTLPRSASLWVQFSPSEVVVEPHSSVNVNAIISVPQAANGGHYTMPVFEAVPVRNEAQSSTTSTTSIGIRFRGLMMLATEDANEYSVEIMGGKVQPPTGAMPLELGLDVRNRSTVHARVHGAFAILDGKGGLAGRGKIDDSRFLPGQRNTLKIPWAGELPAGGYTAVVTLSYNRIGMEPTTLIYEMPFEVGAENQVTKGR
jgi:hypothetical protein